MANKEQVQRSVFRPEDWEGSGNARAEVKGEIGGAEGENSQRFIDGGRLSRPLGESDTEGMAAINYTATPTKEEMKEGRSQGTPNATHPLPSNATNESGSLTASIVARSFRQSPRSPSGGEEGTSRRAREVLAILHAMEQQEMGGS